MERTITWSSPSQDDLTALAVILSSPVLSSPIITPVPEIDDTSVVVEFDLNAIYHYDVRAYYGDDLGGIVIASGDFNSIFLNPPTGIQVVADPVCSLAKMLSVRFFGIEKDPTWEEASTPPNGIVRCYKTSNGWQGTKGRGNVGESFNGNWIINITCAGGLYLPFSQLVLDPPEDTSFIAYSPVGSGVPLGYPTKNVNAEGGSSYWINGNAVVF